MTYNELYRRAEEMLESPFEARQLFTHATNKQVAHLTFLGGREAPSNSVGLLRALCERRLAGEPLQYLLGEWEFYGLPFRVGKGVLIPRQDTETLVDVALELIRDMRSPETLDLCSGTGCVAIALSHERPDAEVTALELSDRAFEFLLENAKINESSIKPVRADLMSYTHPRPLDLLVANPPYIPRDAIASLQKEVLHEPRRALDGGPDGLDFYRAIVRLYRPQLRPDGAICMEVGIGQAAKVRDILAAEGFTDARIKDDYTGTPRVVLARSGVAG